MPQRSRITAEVDFEQEGKQQGFLRLPYSSHRSAYGWIGIPIIVIKNGSGPNVLLTAGNHGDEYEGQITLCKLCRELAVDAVQGRIIIVPALNFPAAQAGMRTSPLDNGNLNRAFPGDPDGTPTQMIAHYVETELMPLVDYSVDLHSGGSSLHYIPSALAGAGENAEQRAQALELLSVFGAPIGYLVSPLGENRTLSAGARRSGVVTLGTELGGSGATSAHTLTIAREGLNRLLRHLGNVPEMSVSEPQTATRLMAVAGRDYYVHSPEYGLWEPCVELGDEVQAGQIAAAVHFPETPWREPLVVHFERAGTVICKRIPGRVEIGDCLFHLATDIETD